MDSNFNLRLKLGDAMWRRVLRPYLFGKDAEDAHFFTVQALKKMQKQNLLWILGFLYRSPHYNQKPVVIGGSTWRNPVGMAAGFDKHGEIIEAIAELGFGSSEIGTVTPRPQEGNLRPRLFRYPDIEAIINRYGFNSVGAQKVADRIKGTFGSSWRFGDDIMTMPIGVSIGKNKETPDEKAVEDYLEAFRVVLPALRVCDWVKINISSPNTPQLRDIFNRLDEFLGAFMEGAQHFVDQQHDALPNGRWLPSFVLKTPPDGLTDNQYEALVHTAVRYGFESVEGTNTTIDDGIKAKFGLTEVGGLSGEPLRELSTEKLRVMKDAAEEASIDLVGVGGISRAEHALEKREAGAKAVQVYTGLVFRGPILIHEILEAWQ